MTIEKLERVMWRLRTRNKDQDLVPNTELRRAIMLEIGTCKRTYQNNRSALIRLRWIKSEGRHHVRLTNNDLTGNE